MIELFKQYQLNPSIELRNKIIEENLKLVYLVKSYGSIRKFTSEV